MIYFQSLPGNNELKFKLQQHIEKSIDEKFSHFKKQNEEKLEEFKVSRVLVKYFRRNFHES